MESPRNEKAGVWSPSVSVLELSRRKSSQKRFLLPVVALFAFVLLSLHDSNNVRLLSSQRKTARVRSWLNTPLDTTKLAWIVETRSDPLFLPLLIHMINVVPADWPFRVVATESVIDHLRRSPSVRSFEAIGKVRLQLLNATAWDFASFGQRTTSEALTDIEFLDQYAGGQEDVHHLFVWQLDSILCANAPTTLNDFLGYDWIGAPWWMEFSGNGGLSIRNLRLMREILTQTERPLGGDLPYEDWWWREQMLARPRHNIANATVAGMFSTSGETPFFYETPLGIHIGHGGADLLGQFRDPSVYERLTSYCPESKMIFKVRP